MNGMGLRHAILRFMPFLSRWMEVTPCCGTCPTCGVIGVTGIAATFVGSLKAPKSEPRDSAVSQSPNGPRMPLAVAALPRNRGIPSNASVVRSSE